MSWQAFYSYSHKDVELRDRLSVYLAPLRRKGRIIEWHDRKIEPGADWNSEVSSHLDGANLVLLLLSPDFLASEYCFGVEVDRCLARLKAGTVKVVPILLRPCLWEDSPFSELQIVPRGAKALSSGSGSEDLWKEVALEISKVVSGTPPELLSHSATNASTLRAERDIDLMREQVRAYARLYERTRQRMEPGSERTHRMQVVFQRMRSLALACYPLLPELVESPSPGERLAAVAVLQAMASTKYLPFLLRTVASDKPFVGYHAVQALRFAVSALEPSAYPELVDSLAKARDALASAQVGLDADRWHELRAAEKELAQTMVALAMEPTRIPKSAG